MAGLIPTYEITELKPASAVRAVAEVAESIIEQETMATAINQAANTGANFVTWSQPISDVLLQTLQAQGYRVVKNSRAANPDNSWTISF